MLEKWGSAVLASLGLLFGVLAVGDIFEAVRRDSMNGIKTALKAGANIDAKGPGGQTPLMHAVLNGKKNAVKYLLKKEADTSIGEKDGYTCMHGAGFQGRYEIAQILIDRGIDPRDKHTDGFEPIERACWGNEERHTATVEVFLKHIELDNDIDAKIISTCLKSSSSKTRTLVQNYVKSKGKTNYNL